MTDHNERACRYCVSLLHHEDACDAVACAQCGLEVEPARRVYAVPACYSCLPPPEPLPVLCVASVDGVRCTCPKCVEVER